jgi:glucuronate isomerase
MQFLAEMYHDLGWGMELHIGAMRNNNSKMFSLLGPDTGFDSIADGDSAYGLSRFLDSLDKRDKLPKTILFNLNPKDNYVLGTMLGNFQSAGDVSRMQFGSAWWFNDNYDGMRAQLQTLMNLGVIGKFVGMVTDSRSFLSYPRHEYFRRILCELIGDLVEQGKYPADIEYLSKLVEDVSFNNARDYFGLTE